MTPLEKKFCAACRAYLSLPGGRRSKLDPFTKNYEDKVVITDQYINIRHYLYYNIVDNKILYRDPKIIYFTSKEKRDSEINSQITACLNLLREEFRDYIFNQFIKQKLNELNIGWLTDDQFLTEEERNIKDILE